MEKQLRRIIAVLLLVLFVASLMACGTSTSRINEENLDKAVKTAEENFKKTTNKKISDYIQETTGLTDLKYSTSVLPSQDVLSYDDENEDYAYYGYDVESNTISLECNLREFKSDKIDEFYTADLNGDNAEKLYNMLKVIYYIGSNDDLSDDYEYVDENEINIKLEVDTSILDSNSKTSVLEIKTSANRVYKLVSDINNGGLISVFIDDNKVYQEPDKSSGAESSDKSSSNGFGKEIQSGKTKNSVWACATDIVKQNLKSPSGAKFCPVYEAKVYNQSGDEYIVTGYVDAENSYGAEIRTKFTVWLTFTGEGYTNGSVVFDE